VDSASIDAIPARPTKPSARELDLAGQIIESLTRPWEPDRYHDTYTDEVKDLLARKAEGGDIVVEEAPEPRAEITDLAEALRASLESARGGGRSGSGRSGSGRAGGAGRSTTRKQAAASSSARTATRSAKSGKSAKGARKRSVAADRKSA